MVFLTSTGFTNPKVYKLIQEHTKKTINSACIITTAAIPLKDRNPLAIKTYDYLNSKKIPTIDYVDIEFKDANSLYNYDLIFILGGDSNHLFNHIKNSNADQVLKDLINQNHVVVGASAGAMLLSSGNEYTKEFNKILGMEEVPPNISTEGLNITDHILFPHYDMISKRVDHLDVKLNAIEQKYNIKITPLNNLDFIYLDNSGRISIIREIPK